MKRTVRRVGRDVGKEVVAVPGNLADEIHRSIKVDVRAIPLHRRLNAILKQRGVGVFAFGTDRVRWLPDSSSSMNKAVLKALIHSSQRIVVAEMPFSVDAGSIARVTKKFGHRHFF